MSLEQQVAALVDAANNLTSTVSGKMTEIDAAVKAAVDGVPAEIRKQMESNLYIDQINGDDSNSGRSPEEAIKTMWKAAVLTPSGGAVDIRVIGNYTFPAEESAQFTNAQVRVRSWGARAKLKFTGYVNENDQFVCNNFYAYRNCAYQFFDIDIELPDIPNGGTNPVTSQQSCIIGSNSQGDVGTPLSIRFANLVMTVPNSATNPFRVTPGFGIVMISTSNLTVPSDWVENNGLLAAMPTDPALYNHTRVIHDSKVLIPTALAT